MRQKDLKSQVLEERSLFKHHWTELVEIIFRNEKKQTRIWEGVHRKNNAKAVVVLGLLQPSGSYVLIRQFRPPTGKYILEFPAGLIDNDESPSETALRELKEETGYHGRIQDVSPPLFSSPGMLSEACYLAFVDIDENNKLNQMPEAKPEPDEFIKVILKKPDQIMEYLESESKKGIGIDIKLYTFFNQWNFRR